MLSFINLGYSGECENPTDTVEANFCLLNEPIIGKLRRLNALKADL